MNTLQVLCLSSTLTLAALGATLSVQAQTQPGQRVEINGVSPLPSLVRQGDEWVLDVPFVSQRTREEVRAEMMAARAKDEYTFSGGDWVRRDRFVSTRTRAEVMAEAAASRARGDFVRYGGEMVLRELIAPAPVLRQEDTAATHAVTTPIVHAR